MFLEKGRTHCEESGIDLDDIVGMRLIEDMHPFRYQVVAMTHHSLGAIRAVEAGNVQPAAVRYGSGLRHPSATGFGNARCDPRVLG